MKTTDKAIIEKYKELVIILSTQTLILEPTTIYAEGNYNALLAREHAIREEIASLEAQDKEPISTPEVIVGPTQIEINKQAARIAQHFRCEGEAYINTQENIACIDMAKWVLSKCKTVNLKDELVKAFNAGKESEKALWQYQSGVIDGFTYKERNISVDDYLHKAEEGK